MGYHKGGRDHRREEGGEAAPASKIGAGTLPQAHGGVARGAPASKVGGSTLAEQSAGGDGARDGAVPQATPTRDPAGRAAPLQRDTIQRLFGRHDAQAHASGQPDHAPGGPGTSVASTTASRYPALARALGDRHDGEPTIDDAATAAVQHKAGGSPVDPDVAGRVGAHLGADLTGVRVHSDPLAQQSSAAMGARAFAYQNDVFLGAGESPSDVKLMAHELTHVVQQGAATAQPQRKIAVGAANDPAEAEADRVADQVAAGPPAGAPTAKAPAASAVLVEDGAPAQPHQMTRSAALAQLRQAAGADGEPAIEHFLAEHGGKTIGALERQARAALGGSKPSSASELVSPLAAKLKGADAAAPGGGGGGSATAAMKPATAAATVQRLGDGVALDSSMAAAAGDAYGADLSGVRVHTGSAAVQLAAEHGARAFTIGNHVAFGAGEHNPGTPVGDAIMAHELAHVVQQQGADPRVQRKPLEVDGHDGAEHEADEAAGGVLARLYTGARAMASNAASRLRTGSGISLQRCSQPKVPVMRVVFGITIIGNGASAKAVDECAAFVTRLISKNKHAQKKMKDDKVTLVIIPHDKKMTDLPQFAALKGTNTFDGRLWDNVRGSGGIRAPDGSFAIGVPEENLTVIAGAADGYGPGYSVGMHELAHVVHSEGMTAAQKTKVTQLYAARQAAGGPWTEAYGSSNEQEYYAQCTNCYFGKNQGIGQNGKAWLRTNDPAMCDFLDELYGKSYDEAGNVEAP